MKVTRLADGPIIRPNMDARLGDNVNGPSLIRVPDWMDSTYLLYAVAGEYGIAIAETLSD
jgi:hypothetical protein